MSNATKLYRIIKSIQGIILTALGIVFCVFFQSPQMHDALSYCVASVLLIYSVLTICFAYLFQRGIASSDMISGVVLTSISVFIFINPDIVTKFLPTLFGTMLVTYSVLLFIETAIYAVQKNKTKLIGYLIAAIIFVVVGSLIIVFGNSKNANQTTASILVLIIGIILIAIGLFSSFFALIAPRREVILASNTLVKTEQIDENNTKVVEKNNKNKTEQVSKNKKSKNKAITKKDKENNPDEEIKAIEIKD